MSRRRSRSSGDTLADALEGLLMLTPWWVGPLVAVGAYLLLRFVGPLLLSGASQPLQDIFGGLARTMAPFGAALVVLIWVIAEIKKCSRRRTLESCSNIDSLRALSWQEFEQLVGEAYRRRGFVVAESGGGGPDGGVDLVLTRNGVKTLVQCKQWRTWKVGVKIVRELYGVMTAEGAGQGIVATCGSFTADAKAFAGGKPLDLVDGPALWRLVEGVQTSVRREVASGDQPKAPAAVMPPPSADQHAAADNPVCPKCGSAMVLRTARKGQNAGSQFYGCSRYPQCRGTRPAGTSAT